MNTPIAVRIPADLLDEIDREATAFDRSRHWVILRRLRDGKYRTVARNGYPGSLATPTKEEIQNRVDVINDLRTSSTPLQEAHSSNCRCFMCKK